MAVLRSVALIDCLTNPPKNDVGPEFKPPRPTDGRHSALFQAHRTSRRLCFGILGENCKAESWKRYIVRFCRPDIEKVLPRSASDELSPAGATRLGAQFNTLSRSRSLQGPLDGVGDLAPFQHLVSFPPPFAAPFCSQLFSHHTSYHRRTRRRPGHSHQPSLLSPPW